MIQQAYKESVIPRRRAGAPKAKLAPVLKMKRRAAAKHVRTGESQRDVSKDFFGWWRTKRSETRATMAEREMEARRGRK